MTLERAAEPAGAEAGLWQDPTWTPDMPGTFAVIIGVSAYHHLNGGDRQTARETFGLPQLHVSALTAWELFTWLREEYFYPGVPVARVWLLLSPGPAEIAHAPELATAAPAATWEACQRAIKAWFWAMTRELSAAAAAESRALFAFSGHGFEISGNQLLLPDDYMSPNDAENPDCAISVDNLVRALAAAPVPTQLFFPDACRNDVDALLRYDVSGMKILPTGPRNLANAARVAPVLKATASGSTAWQPNDPALGLSLYGETLLEALRGTGDITVDWSIDPTDILLQPVQDYLNRRIPALLLERYNQQVLQPVRLGGESANAIITKLHRMTAAAAAPPEDEAAAFADEELAAPAAPLPTLLPEPPTIRDTDASIATAMAAPFPIQSPDISGSETMEAMWGTARLYNLRQRAWVGLDTLRVRDVRRDESTRAYRIAFSVEDSVGDHWLELSDGERTFACLLPGDPAGAPRYAIELARSYQSDGPPRVTQFLPSLALDNPDATGTAVALWERLRRGLPVAPGDVERAFDRAEPGSIAATILLLVAIRLRMARGDSAPAWVERVGAGGTAAPDAGILAAEVALIRGEDRAAAEQVRGALEAIGTDGLPRFAESFTIVLDQIEDDEALREASSLPPRPDDEIALVVSRWLRRRASPVFRAGGLLTTFAGPPSLVGVELLFPQAMS